MGSKDIDVTRWSKRSLIPVTLSFALLLAALALVGMLNEPDTKGTQFVRKGSQLVTIAGDTRRKEDGLDVLGFSNNVAILSTGPIQIEAKQLELLSIEITGTNRLPATLFWRQEGRSDLHNAGLADINVNFFDLRQQEGWTGNVTEIGIVLYDDGGQISIGSLTLQPRTLAALSQKLIGDWTWLSDWNLRSVNWIPAGRKDSLVALPLFATGWLVIAVLILALYVPRRHLAVAAFSSFLLIWISLDVRWLINRTYMASRTIESYEFGSSQPLDFGFDSIILDAVDKALCRRNEESRGTCTTGEHRMLVITSASAEDMRFQTLRAKYHALPTSAQVHRGDVGALRLANPNDILVLKQRFGADQDVTKSSAAYIAELKSEVKSTPYIAWETDNAFLISWRQTLLVP